MGVTAGVVSAVAAVGSAYVSNESRKDAKKAQAAAANEQRAAEVDAINKANAGAAMRRKALRDNSLFTGAGAGDAGKTTLGVGG